MQRKHPLRRGAGVPDRLWLRLKALETEGWNFRKASPFQTFILPFVEHEALLVVELEADHADRSPVRDRLLREAGYTILRFPRADAEVDLAGVVETIRAVLQDRKT
jgi:very-short-patch-repair endonuclease